MKHQIAPLRGTVDDQKSAANEIMAFSLDVNSLTKVQLNEGEGCQVNRWLQQKQKHHPTELMLSLSTSKDNLLLLQLSIEAVCVCKELQKTMSKCQH